MQTQASWQAVQRATPASSRRTFWNVLKGSAVTLIIGVTLLPPTFFFFFFVKSPVFKVDKVFEQML